MDFFLFYHLYDLNFSIICILLVIDNVDFSLKFLYKKCNVFTLKTILMLADQLMYNFINNTR